MDRRDFVKRALAGSSLVLAFKTTSGALLLSPREAHARLLPFQILKSEDVSLLEQVAELIVPGSVEAGTIHFIDHQLGVSPDDCLLILKYFEVPPPYSNFYQGGIAAIRQLAREQFDKKYQDLDEQQRAELVRMIATPDRMSSDGFPLFLFYMCLRSDAVDLVYGTPDGFKKLNVPYMAHIMPPEDWDG